MSDDPLTPAQASAQTGVPVTQLLRWAALSIPPHVYTGPEFIGSKHKPMYERAALDKWIGRIINGPAPLNDLDFIDARMTPSRA